MKLPKYCKLLNIDVPLDAKIGELYREAGPSAIAAAINNKTPEYLQHSASLSTQNGTIKYRVNISWKKGLILSTWETEISTLLRGLWLCHC